MRGDRLKEKKLVMDFSTNIRGRFADRYSLKFEAIRYLMQLVRHGTH